MVFRIWLFGIHGEVLNFRNWTLCYHELFRINRKKQNNEFIDGSVTFMNFWTLWILNHGFYGFIGLDLDLTMDLLIFDDKSIFKLWTLNYVDCIPFSCIDSFHMTPNGRRFYSPISEKRDQASTFIEEVLKNQSCSTVHPSVWCIFLRIYLVEFLIFLLPEDIVSYILKSDKARFWKIAYVLEKIVLCCRVYWLLIAIASGRVYVRSLVF